MAQNGPKNPFWSIFDPMWLLQYWISLHNSIERLSRTLKSFQDRLRIIKNYTKSGQIIFFSFFLHFPIWSLYKIWHFGFLPRGGDQTSIFWAKIWFVMLLRDFLLKKIIRTQNSKIALFWTTLIGSLASQINSGEIRRYRCLFYARG